MRLTQGRPSIALVPAACLFAVALGTSAGAAGPSTSFSPPPVAYPQPGSTGTFVRPIEYALPSLSGRPSVTDTARVKSRAGVFTDLMVSPSREIYSYVNDDRFINATDAERFRLLQPIVIDQRFSTAREVESILDLRGRPIVLRAQSGAVINVGGVDIAGIRFASLSINTTVSNANITVIPGTTPSSTATPELARPAKKTVAAGPRSATPGTTGSPTAELSGPAAQGPMPNMPAQGLGADPASDAPNPQATPPTPPTPPIPATAPAAVPEPSSPAGTPTPAPSAPATEPSGE